MSPAKPGGRKMHLHNSIGDAKKFSVAPNGTPNPSALEPRAHARGYTLPPASAGSLNGFLKLAVLLSILLSSGIANAQSAASPEPASIETSSFDKEVTDFFTLEMTAHLNEIQSYNPAPDKVFGAGATGEYTWGSFMNSVGAFAALTGRNKLGNRDLAREVGQVGLLEYRLKGTRFSQLYGVLALRYFGKDLDSNSVWKGLTEEQRSQWRSFLNISAFYDPKTRQVINLPENYLGVAARIASVSYQLGLTKDRALVDGVITRAAQPFANQGIYADDAPPTGRFDRYSNEYARFVWEAAEAAGRKDILDAVRPSLKEQMRLWWDLVLPDGYGYAWGRSMGVVSYMDTLEIVGFLAKHPEFRPAPLAELASAYYQAWQWLRHDYNDKTHILSVFAFGRGNYSYISRDREWQQTINFFGKGALAHERLITALKHEQVSTFPAEIVRPDVARFVFFRQGDRPAGVWLVRQGSMFFTLPITTGTKPGVADYLPAPHGLVGFANPVEQVYASLVPFLQLADGRTLVATDGADEVEPGADGKSLRVIWRRWALLNKKAGELIDPHITSEVVWRIDGSTLTRDETLRSDEDITLYRWWVAVPSTLNRDTRLAGTERQDLLNDENSSLLVTVKADWPVNISAWAPGDSALGRGARRSVPLHLIYESPHLRLPAKQDMHWRMTIKFQKILGP
ncbi:MAG TPA: hypothetical protein VGO56_06875 [Pyrinomonadaceae bacterium]|jgi:hypothetical protein|nr:hypothetical protein [Pyrinomonadaceae bacterium]